MTTSSMVYTVELPEGTHAHYANPTSLVRNATGQHDLPDLGGVTFLCDCTHCSKPFEPIPDNHPSRVFPTNQMDWGEPYMWGCNCSDIDGALSNIIVTNQEFWHTSAATTVQAYQAMKKQDAASATRKANDAQIEANREAFWAAFPWQGDWLPF